MDLIIHEGHNLDEMEAVFMITVAIEAVVDTQDASEKPAISKMLSGL